MKTITILSGKGGTGKTSISSSLAVELAKKYKIVAADCDVDAPNLGIILGLNNPDYSWESIQTSEKAKLIEDKCIGCKKCVDTCVFSAIKWDGKPIFNKYLCEGCGACQLICPAKAIELIKVKNGKIGQAKTNYGFNLISGQLDIGESGSGKVVEKVRSKAEKLAKKQKADYIIIDSSPGIGCPVIASIVGSDYVVAVTEPTPSALNDLKRVLKVVEYFKIPHSIIINRWNINKDFSQKIENFAKENSIKILRKIYYDKVFVDALVNLKPVVVYDNKLKSVFHEISSKLIEILK